MPVLFSFLWMTVFGNTAIWLDMSGAASIAAVFALSSLSVEVELERWPQLSTILVLAMGTGAAAALLASAYQVVMSEWLFVYHEPPRLPDLLNVGPDQNEEQVRGLLAASYSVAYEQYLKGNAVSAIRRTWALRLILLSLLRQAVAFVVLLFHRAGW